MSKKVQIARASGAPLTLKNIEAYDLEFKARYDVILSEAGSDMPTVQDLVQALQDELQRKYEIIGDEVLPKSAKGWQALITKYGAPIMIAQSSEDLKKHVLVIMDQPFG